MGKRCPGWLVLATAFAACAGDADAPGSRTVASVLEEAHGAATEIIRDAGGQFSVGAFVARQNAELLVPQLAAVAAATDGKAVSDLNDVQQSFRNGTLNAADDMQRSERYPRKKATAMLAQADALLSTLTATYRFPRVLDFTPRYVVAPAVPTALDLTVSGHALDASGPELTRNIALPVGSIFVTLHGRQADGRVYEDTSSEAAPHPWYATTIDMKSRRMVIHARALDEALAQP